MRYRPIPDAWKREVAQQCDSDALKIVRDELARIRRALDRKEGEAAGLERAVRILRHTELPHGCPTPPADVSKNADHS